MIVGQNKQKQKNKNPNLNSLWVIHLIAWKLFRLWFDDWKWRMRNESGQSRKEWNVEKNMESETLMN